MAKRRNPTGRSGLCEQCGRVHKQCAGHRRRPAGSTAKLQPCGASPRRGKAVCRNHGGNTPAGIASPHFKHGNKSRYLQHLPASLAAHFDQDSKNLVALTEELAVIEARIIDVLDRMKGAAKITTVHRKELDDLFDRKARLVGVESRRRKDEHEMVARDDFSRFARALLMAVASRVDDAKVRGLIQEDVLRVLTISQVPMLTPGEVA